MASDCSPFVFTSPDAQGANYQGVNKNGSSSSGRIGSNTRCWRYGRRRRPAAVLRAGRVGHVPDIGYGQKPLLSPRMSSAPPGLQSADQYGCDFAYSLVTERYPGYSIFQSYVAIA